MMKATIGERIHAHYSKDNLDDGRGGKLIVRHIAELASGVGCATDSLDEVDIFFDLHQWQVADSVPYWYRLYLPNIKKATETVCKEMGIEYNMRVIAESAWFPYYGRKHSSFFAAQEHAKLFLTPKENLAWHPGPIAFMF